MTEIKEFFEKTDILPLIDDKSPAAEGGILAQVSVPLTAEALYFEF